ncbi:hypothetical protein PSP6_210151 [Paraburkholderia tropica]|nr:hypothetical protein PSP6_210151 [Paraburkholderia tropica]
MAGLRQPPQEWALNDAVYTVYLVAMSACNASLYRDCMMSNDGTWTYRTLGLYHAGHDRWM